MPRLIGRVVWRRCQSLDMEMIFWERAKSLTAKVQAFVDDDDDDAHGARRRRRRQCKGISLAAALQRCKPASQHRG